MTEPERPAFVSELDACPECGTAWAYEAESGGRISRIVGIYDVRLDRTVEWLCPECGTRWPRGATVET